MEIMGTIRSAFGQRELQRTIAGTYFVLRVGIVMLTLLVPFGLWAWGEISEGISLRDSISAYYEVDQLRDEFVGLLFAAGTALILYRGYTGFENWALNIAGVALFLVALVPASKSDFHGVAAGVFFVASAYVVFFRSTDTLTADLVPDSARRTWYRNLYWLMSALMVVSIVLAFAFELARDSSRLVFTLETVGISAFGLYWAIKTWEIHESRADQLAAAEELTAAPYGVGEMFKQVPFSTSPGPTAAT
jgi:hypothetical protein